jgi:hypothetical protein
MRGSSYSSWQEARNIEDAYDNQPDSAEPCDVRPYLTGELLRIMQAKLDRQLGAHVPIRSIWRTYPSDDYQGYLESGAFFQWPASGTLTVQLVENAVRNAHHRHPKGARWGHVTKALAVGSGSAIQLCERFGLDPEEQVGVEDDPHCGTCGNVGTDLCHDCDEETHEEWIPVVYPKEP